MTMLHSVVGLMASGGGGGGATDADAIAFLAAAGIVDPTITSSIDAFVIGLKAAAIWTELIAVYPFVGGTGFTHKWNLKSPVDADANFRLTFGASVTHGANGITSPSSAGSTSSADTHVVPVTSLPDRNFSAGCLNHTAPDVDNAPNGNYMGCQDSNSTPRFTRLSSNSMAIGMNGNARTLTPITHLEFLATSNSDATDLSQCYIDGVATGAGIDTSFFYTPSGVNLHLMRFNSNGTIQGLCAFTMKFAFVGAYLDGTDMANFNTLVHDLQADLGR